MGLNVYLPIFPSKRDGDYLGLVRAEEDLAYLQKFLLPSINLFTGSDIPEPPEFEILVTGRPQREYLTASWKLHTLIIPFAGLPETTRALLSEFPQLNVHNLHFNAEETAEMAMTLLMAAAKNLVPIDREFRAHNWTPRYEKKSASILLAGKTALVLGYGAIGKRIAASCLGLGMKVVAAKRSLQSSHTPNLSIHTFEEIQSILPLANCLISTLPHTTQTEGIIGKAELDLLPDEAIIVNVGRAKVIDEHALYETLRTRPIRAGLDVWYKYPSDQSEALNTKPSEFPFHELENVVMSPHRGGHSTEMQRRRMEALAHVLNIAVDGNEIPNTVNLEHGY